MKISTLFTLLFACLLALGFAGCKKNRTTGDINVTVTVLQGETVDLTGILVQLHATAMFEHVLFSTEATGTPTSVSAQFENLEPGKYYICAWKDKDGDSKYSTGDFFGFYPSAVDLVAKDKKEIPVEAYLLD